MTPNEIIWKIPHMRLFRRFSKSSKWYFISTNMVIFGNCPRSSAVVEPW